MPADLVLVVDGTPVEVRLGEDTDVAAAKAVEAAASAAAAAASEAAVAADQATVAADKAIVAADKATVAADKAIVAADKATVATDKGIVAADKAIVAADKATVASDKATVAADKAIVAADKAIVAVYKTDAEAAAATAETVATSVSETLQDAQEASLMVETLGRAVTPVTGSNNGAATYVFGDPLVHDGTWTTVRVFGMTGGTIKLRRFTKSGNDFTQVGSDTNVVVAAGANTLPVAIAVSAGEYLGFYAPANTFAVTTALADGVGWYAGSGDTTAFTDSTLEIGSILQIGFDVSYFPVPAQTQKTNDNALSDLADAFAATQTIGRPVASPPETGTNSGLFTYVFADALTRDSALARVRLYAMVDSQIRVRRFTMSGNDFTQAGSDLVLVARAGSNTFTFTDRRAFEAGEYVGFAVISTGGIATTVATGDSGGFYAAAGNQTSFTDATTNTASRLEIGFDFETVAITAEEIEALQATVTTQAAQIAALEAAQSVSGSVGERLDDTNLITAQIMLLCVSQSNGIGPQNSLLSSTALTPIRTFGSVRYIDYLTANAPHWSAGDSAAWLALDREAEEIQLGGWGETGHVLGANQFVDQWRRKTGSDFALSGKTLRVAASGSGGRTALELMTSPGYLDFTYAVIDAGAARADDAGEDFSLGLVEYDQGEEDMTEGTDPGDYGGYLANLPGILRTRQLSATTAIGSPVDRKVRVAGFQTAKHATYAAGAARLAAWAIAVEQARVFEQHPLWCAICPTYMFTYFDTSHLIDDHNAVKRGYMARARAEYHGLGIRPRHLRVISVTWSTDGGNDVVDVQYAVPVGELVVDTTTVTDPGSLGASFHEADEDEVTVVSAAIKDGTTDTMRFVATGTTATKLRLGYKATSGVGSTAGGRICFRDQAGDAPGGIFDPDGIAWPMHNWPLMDEFEKP